jgi:hypothetical protein
MTVHASTPSYHDVTLVRIGPAYPLEGATGIIYVRTIEFLDDAGGRCTVDAFSPCGQPLPLVLRDPHEQPAFGDASVTQ